MLEYIVLGTLNYSPMTGYELKQFIDSSTNHFWHAKQSQIYRTLKRLEEQNRVISEVEAQDGRPDRRVYNITEAGQAALQQWLAQPLTEVEQTKSVMLLKLFFSAQIGKEAIVTQLRLQRMLHQQQLAVYANESPALIAETAVNMPQLANDTLLWDATRRFGELYEAMIIAWLDETINRIETEF